MKSNIFTRVLCVLLTVLTVVAMVPALSLTAFAEGEEEVKPYQQDFTKVVYASAEERLAAMTMYYENSDYALYVEQADDPNTATVESTGVVAYVKKATGEILFTNPWNTENIKHSSTDVEAEQMSQFLLTFSGGEEDGGTLNSYTDAVQKGQVTIKNINNGVRVEYAIGDRSARILVPRVIERETFEEKILIPMSENIPGGTSSREFLVFYSYFNDMFYATDTTLSETKKESIAMNYPVTKEKNIDIYVCDINASVKQLRELEAMIKTYCPAYTFEDLDNDHMYVNYESDVMSPAVFKTALDYTLDENGMLVTMSANGLRFDESVYRISEFRMLPYMGASLKSNEGYSFVPDGSGALYELDTPTTTETRVYGDDYALSEKLYVKHTEEARMPVFGQVETDAETGISRGYLAVIEEGESLAFIAPDHDANRKYSTVKTKFIIRPSDVSQSGWSVYADRRYTDNYSIRYIMLSDDTLAQNAGLSSYYECSWMGMACAYRDYLDATADGFDRLTAEETGDSIPLYIETFGSVDTVKKVLSIPVTVSVAMTSFEDIATMYDYLAGNGVSNVNFKMTGYANGGMYADVPYKLKWEKSAGGASGYEELVAKAKDAGFGLYPDFDFVYTSQGSGGSKVNMKKHASRTIDNRYTTRRSYSATHQAMVSHFQMVMSPVTYSRFYEKLEENYAKYGNAAISLSTLGSSLNSDYDEDKISLREESKGYVTEALAYFKNKSYDVMVEGGNAYTWGYADHVLNVPLDSSRYNTEYSSVPFMGVVLHGYVQFAGSAFNMEGDLTYAMLKAMENGASAYFVLSYANTELLKEDEILSQNYSVRYDIWQTRLVEIYKELNAVLCDVQDKVIINHEILNANSSRVQDADELLQDIAADAKEKADAVKQKIDEERVAELIERRNAFEMLKGVSGEFSALTSRVSSAIYGDGMISQFKDATGATPLLKAWNARLSMPVNATAAQRDALNETLRSWLNTYVVTGIVTYRSLATSAKLSDESAAALLQNSKAAYDLLVADRDEVEALYNEMLAGKDVSKSAVAEKMMIVTIEDAKQALDAKNSILTQARANLVAAVNAYVSVVDAADGRVYVSNGATCHEGSVYVTEGAVNDYVDGNKTDASALALSYRGEVVTVSDADLEDFLFGGGAADEKYAHIGAEQLYDAIVRQLKNDGLYNELGVEAMIAEAQAQFNAPEEEEPETPDEDVEGTPEDGEDVPETDDSTEDESAETIVPDPPKDKYAVDNNVVVVTYGADRNTPYKAILLNFNDYAVKTSYNGINYTVEAYGYVVIKY